MNLPLNLSISQNFKSRLRVSFISDIHLSEKNKLIPKDLVKLRKSNVDVLLILGDISSDPSDWKEFLQIIRKYFSSGPILFLMGNHEYYNHDINTATKDYAQAIQDDRDAYILDNSNIIINGINFIGSTLWSSFELGKDISIAEKQIFTFKRVKNGNRYITKNEILEIHRQSLRFIQNSIHNSLSECNVVITHYPPITLKNLSLLSGYELDGAQCSPLEDFIIKNKPQYWLYAHIHEPLKKIVGETILMNNAFGADYNTYHKPDFEVIDIYN